MDLSMSPVRAKGMGSPTCDRGWCSSRFPALPASATLRPTRAIISSKTVLPVPQAFWVKALASFALSMFSSPFRPAPPGADPPKAGAVPLHILGRAAPLVNAAPQENDRVRVVVGMWLRPPEPKDPDAFLVPQERKDGFPGFRPVIADRHHEF